MTNNKNAREAFKKIPSVDEILKTIDLESLPVHFLKSRINQILNKVREDIISNNIPVDIYSFVMNEVEKQVRYISKPSLKSVINGTGIILNTSLGRAPISKSILESVSKTIYPYCNLEIDLNSNSRGERLNHIEPLINSLVGSQKSILVNNNAAAVMIMLNSLCFGKEVIISRGQQVEIGGSFRIPDIIKSSGCKMVEVGTTNKTSIKDYVEAINNKTAAILHVHTSNYKVIGFTDEVDLKELAKICKEHKVDLLCDLGSGSIYNKKSNFISVEKEVQKYISSGVDIVTYSGDKLLGGAQGGIISGLTKLINKIHDNPMYRTLRCDKYRIALFEKILRTYINNKEVTNDNLSIMLFERPQEKLNDNANKIIKSINKKVHDKYNVKIKKTNVEAGSGSLPTEKIPSIAITINSNNKSTNKISNALRNCSTPILTYINNDKVFIDLKAITDDQIETLIKMLNSCL
tara:strand:+ start:3564 stop:4952 length:1389 start_codon:yes stop_codon:yes gene_type:complete